jgi:hypothetical protein
MSKTKQMIFDGYFCACVIKTELRRILGHFYFPVRKRSIKQTDKQECMLCLSLQLLLTPFCNNKKYKMEVRNNYLILRDCNNSANMRNCKLCDWPCEVCNYAGYVLIPLHLVHTQTYFFSSVLVRG